MSRVWKPKCCVSFDKGQLSARDTHDLELDSLSLEVNGADLEVDLGLSAACMRHEISRTHTNGRDVALGVGVVGETEKKTRLADTGVTDKEKLWVSKDLIAAADS